MFKGWIVLVCATALLLRPADSAAQIIESLTVSLTPGSLTFALTSNSSSNSGSALVAAETSWVLSPTRTSITLYAYFSSASAALAHTSARNTMDIPSSQVEVSINGAANAPFNQSVAFGAPGAGRQIFSQPIAAVNLTGTRTDSLALNINLAGYPLPADSYVGALRVRAMATP